MNLAEFKDYVSQICLASALVASWHLTQETAQCAKFKSFYYNDIFLSLNSGKLNYDLGHYSLVSLVFSYLPNFTNSHCLKDWTSKNPYIVILSIIQLNILNPKAN